MSNESARANIRVSAGRFGSEKVHGVRICKGNIVAEEVFSLIYAGSSVLFLVRFEWRDMVIPFFVVVFFSYRFPLFVGFRRFPVRVWIRVLFVGGFGSIAVGGLSCSARTRPLAVFLGGFGGLCTLVREGGKANGRGTWLLV